MRYVFTTILGESYHRHPDGRRERYTIKPPLVGDGVTRWVCFTDRDDLELNGWEIRKLDTGGHARQRSKEVKALPWMFLGDATETIWIDSTVQLKVTPSKLFDMVEGCDLGLFRHWERSTAAEEVAAVKNRHGIDLSHQVDRLRSAGEDGATLYQGAVVIRMDTPAARSFSWEWWSEIQQWGLRDMPSIGVVADRVGATVSVIGDRIYENPLLQHEWVWCER